MLQIPALYSRVAALRSLRAPDLHPLMMYCCVLHCLTSQGYWQANSVDNKGAANVAAAATEAGASRLVLVSSARVCCAHGSASSACQHPSHSRRHAGLQHPN
eukprot:363017-Chlamydomonas_euryale.AAC.8